MRRRFVPLCALSFAALTISAQSADAQRVLGVGDDALVLPRGVLRIRVLQQNTNFNERYGAGTFGRPDGALEPLGIDFNLDTVGKTEFPALGALETGIQRLTGMPDFRVSLGRTIVGSDVRVSATPVVVEAGVTSKLSLGVIVPYVRTRNEIFFNVNPDGREGNVGFNPANAGVVGTTFPGLIGAQDANRNVQAQFSAAAAQLQGTLDFCQANPAAGSCPMINAQRGNALALIQNSTAFAGGLSQIYGDGTSFGSPFVPVAGSEAQQAIQARIVAFNGLFGQFGVVNRLTAQPTSAPNRLGLSQAQQILTDPIFGVSGSPLQSTERSHIGDIEVGAKFAIFDTFGQDTRRRLNPTGLGLRAAVTGVVRLPTGQTDAPTSFVDVGTGQGQTDLEGRLSGDVVFTKFFWASFITRYTIQMKDDQFVRILDAPNRTLAASYRQRRVERDLGDYYEFEMNPRVVLNDYFAIGGHYFYRQKEQDQYTGSFVVPAAESGFDADPSTPALDPITINANILNLETEQREHRFGGGFSFSTVAAFDKGKARLPLEITYLHFQTTRGEGNVPKLFSDQIQLRLYTRIFGN